jgi:hypothetical protein
MRESAKPALSIRVRRISVNGQAAFMKVVRRAHDALTAGAVRLSLAARGNNRDGGSDE